MNRNKKESFEGRDGDVRISEIHVKGLFGKFSFNPIDLLNNERMSSLTFLYGENGIGKTTLLKLVYSILSTERSSGHRGFIGRTKFKEISIKFENEQIVSVFRDDISSSTYKYIFIGPKSNKKFTVKLNSDKRATPQTNPDIDQITDELDLISPTILFVNDQRTIRSTFEPWDIQGQINRQTHRELRIGVAMENPGYFGISDNIISSGLEWSLQTVQEIFTARALSEIASANQNTGEIYLSIARALAKSRDQGARPEIASGQILGRIETIDNYLKDYGRYGLVQGEALPQIAKLISQLDSKKASDVIEIVEPYIKSIESRIAGTRELADQISLFEMGINKFLNRKHMECRIGSHIKFVDDEGNEINGTGLSSGESHLLFLCSAAIMSRVRDTFIIIDEPELSLNYKWQRQLMEVLSEISGKRSQFLIATHSFEIISSYRNDARVLEPI